MQAEYLLFNLIVISGPFALSFDKRVHFVRLWGYTFSAALISLVPFIIWDILVSGKHWWFNGAYTLSLRILGLPLGEWLFFVTIPFSCIFVWEVLRAYFSNRVIHSLRILYLLPFILIPAGVAVFYSGREYTGIVVSVFGIVLLFDYILKTRIVLNSRTVFLIGIVSIFILIFNGYLTARPVVLYDPSYQLDFRITTVPVEDFLYGYAHVLLALVVFERLRKKKNA